MDDGWTKRSRSLSGGRVEEWLERPLPGYPKAGAVEQMFGDAVALVTRSSQPTAVRSQSVVATTEPTSSRARVVLADAVRADIRRELASWDGRETGGALVGRQDGNAIVIEHAGGLGNSVETDRAATWLRSPVTRYFDLALSFGLDLVGQWHTHSAAGGVAQSQTDERHWEAVRAALGAPAYVGLICAPRRAIAVGLAAELDDEVWAWTDTEFAVYVTTADGCRAVPPPT